MLSCIFAFGVWFLHTGQHYVFSFVIFLIDREKRIKCCFPTASHQQDTICLQSRSFHLSLSFFFFFNCFSTCYKALFLWPSAVFLISSLWRWPFCDDFYRMIPYFDIYPLICTLFIFILWYFEDAGMFLV